MEGARKRRDRPRPAGVTVRPPPRGTGAAGGFGPLTEATAAVGRQQPMSPQAGRQESRQRGEDGPSTASGRQGRAVPFSGGTTARTAGRRAA